MSARHYFALCQEVLCTSAPKMSRAWYTSVSTLVPKCHGSEVLSFLCSMSSLYLFFPSVEIQKLYPYSITGVSSQNGSLPTVPDENGHLALEILTVINGLHILCSISELRMHHCVKILLDGVLKKCPPGIFQ